MFSVKPLMKVTIINFLLLFGLRVSETTIANSDTLQRNRRQLLFPNSTLLQFNAGFGTPTLANMINMNWIFQANFQLPWNRTQIPVDILYANTGYDGDSRKKRDVDDDGRERNGDYESDVRLYHFYNYVEGVLSFFGYNGSACVLRALCQIGAEPLHSDDEEDLLHEIATYVLNPTYDEQPIQEEEGHRYIEAYQRGQKNEDCIKIYDDCSTSIIDSFTKLYDAV